MARKTASKPKQGEQRTITLVDFMLEIAGMKRPEVPPQKKKQQPAALHARGRK